MRPVLTSLPDDDGETRNVGNGEFLLAVFGDDLADARPLVVSFEGNPGSGPKKRWFGLPWRERIRDISELAAYRQQLLQSRDIQARRGRAVSGAEGALSCALRLHAR